jgi:hypothetical protein
LAANDRKPPMPGSTWHSMQENCEWVEIAQWSILGPSAG